MPWGVLAIQRDMSAKEQYGSVGHETENRTISIL